MNTRGRDPAAQLIVFTDLDGSLLDSATYSFQEALGALSELARRGVPVIFNSSKTAAEQRHLRRQLGMPPAPFIVENGSAILVDENAGLATDARGWQASRNNERVFVIGSSAQEVRAAISRISLATGVPLRGYADLSVTELARITALEGEAALRAAQREYSETLVDELPEAQWAVLEKEFARQGLRAASGGRFRTVTAAQASKGDAVRLVARLYQSQFSRPPLTAALGDSDNDESMLRAVQMPYLLSARPAPHFATGIPNLRVIKGAGPVAWSAAVRELLEQLRNAVNS